MKGLSAWPAAACMAALVLGCSDPDSGPPLGDFPAISKTELDAAFTLTAPSSRSPAPFTFTSSNAAVATIAGATVTIKGAGSSTITASQPSMGSFGPTSKSTTLTVTAATCVSPATVVNSQCLAPALPPNVTNITTSKLIFVAVTFSDTWTRGRDYCNSSVIDSVGGWRQPTAAELTELVGSGVIAGHGWAPGEAWSSNGGVAAASHVVVNLSSGTAAERADTATAYVSCVK